MSREGVSDEALQSSLSVYAGMVSWVLTDPERWLGVEALAGSPEASVASPRGMPRKALQFARRRLFGTITPASARWPDQPLRFRIRWWVRRIGMSAAVAAAAPRFAGALSDRVPLQAALGASSAGLAVCAVAREHGLQDPAEWVPLLAQVLFDRPLLSRSRMSLDAAEAEQRLESAAGDTAEPPSGLAAVGATVQRSVRALWGLARALLDVQHLLDRRPRGGLIARSLGKFPVVGVFGGWLDERGGTRRAARQAHRLLSRR